jgi:phosphoadenosine phosphosulfate reductase
MNAATRASAMPPSIEQELVDRLAGIAHAFPHVAFASSLGAEDMVLTDAMLRAGLAIEIFTLDTGRLHRETLEVIDQVKACYGYAITVVRPEAAAVEAYVRDHGANAFYESVDLRKACCRIRKVEPLARALTGKSAWITGLRRAQATTRSDLALREEDGVHGIPKFNPLADWSEQEVWAYLRSHDVPYNALHDRGYPSIGCDPCTRAIKAGEDVRAGRWWWESADSKECGLHVAPDGTLQRAGAARP